MPILTYNGAVEEYSLSFQELVSNLLPEPDSETISHLAEMCCKQCGGLPEGCTCIDDFVSSPAWQDLPNVVDILPAVVANFREQKSQHV